MMRKLITTMLLGLAFSAMAQAGVPAVIKNMTYFNTVGAVDSFSWAPARYENTFRYDVFYYIPKTVKASSKVPALIFTHGGGSSTMTREGSIDVVKMYMPDLKKMADELGIIVVLPSANGLNWGGHTRGLMRDLARLMRKDLRVDVNRIGVSGHSMGGMGITRNYLWTADEFAFYMPMAAGMDEKHQTEHHLNKVFNVPYVHLQGLHDHFDVFITRCQEQLKRTQALEVQYGLRSMMDIVFYNGSHNYDYQLFKQHLSKLIKNFPRDLYQKELWGTIHTVKTKLIENNISYDYDSEARYFWIEATDTDLTTAERIDFHAKIDGNVISIDMPVMPKNSKGLKIYLHSKMVDLNQKVEITLNGKLIATRAPKAGVLRNLDVQDSGFKFEDVVAIKF